MRDHHGQVDYSLDHTFKWKILSGKYPCEGNGGKSKKESGGECYKKCKPDAFPYFSIINRFNQLRPVGIKKYACKRGNDEQQHKRRQDKHYPAEGAAFHGKAVTYSHHQGTS